MESIGERTKRIARLFKKLKGRTLAIKDAGPHRKGALTSWVGCANELGNPLCPE